MRGEWYDMGICWITKNGIDEGVVMVKGVAAYFSSGPTLGARRLLARLTALVVVSCALWLPQAGEAAFYNTQDEIELGRKISKAVEKEYKLSPDKSLQERVQRLGRALAAAADRLELPYTFKVLESKEINAFALPGGPVYIFRGLADYMSDDELAGVIGHEIGHIVKRHSLKQMEKSMGLGLLTLLLLGDKALPLQTVMQQAVMAGYSRDDEREADYLGFTLTTKADFSPYSMELGLRKLAKVHDAPDYGLFSSHPEPEARIGLLQKYIAKGGIRPQVISDGTNGRVADGAWTFAADESTSYAVAGALYRIARRGDVRPDWFILDNDGTSIRVYYDNIIIVTVTAQEAAIAGLTTEEQANRYIASFREWAAARVK